MSRPDLYVGDTGSGKSRLAATAAEWVFKTTGKHTRLYTADGDELYRPHIATGILDVCDLYELNAAPFEALMDACNGWWPQNGKMAELSQADFEATGLWIFEGLTPFSEWMMLQLADKAATGGKLGEESPIRFKDGTREVGGSSRTHYNIVQMELRGLVKRTYRLPGIKIWTAREAKGTDEETRKTSFAPQTAAGHKFSIGTPGWFGNCLGLELRRKVGALTSIEYVLHTTPWFDPNNPTVPHLAKIRDYTYAPGGAVAVSRMPAELVGAQINAENFYTLLAKAESKAEADLATRLGLVAQTVPSEGTKTGANLNEPKL